jgi:hypothetical protein
MSDSPSDPRPPEGLPPEYLYGLHVRLDGGQEESLVDPTETSQPEVRDPRFRQPPSPEALHGVIVRYHPDSELPTVWPPHLAPLFEPPPVTPDEESGSKE